MDEKIKQLKSTTFYGRRYTRRQLADIQRTVELFPKLSRKELAQTICEHLGWRTAKGDNRYQACLRLLQRLEELALLRPIAAGWLGKQTGDYDTLASVCAGHADLYHGRQWTLKLNRPQRQLTDEALWSIRHRRLS